MSNVQVVCCFEKTEPWFCSVFSFHGITIVQVVIVLGYVHGWKLLLSFFAGLFKSLLLFQVVIISRICSWLKIKIKICSWINFQSSVFVLKAFFWMWDLESYFLFLRDCSSPFCCQDMFMAEDWKNCSWDYSIFEVFFENNSLDVGFRLLPSF